MIKARWKASCSTVVKTSHHKAVTLEAARSTVEVFPPRISPILEVRSMGLIPLCHGSRDEDSAVALKIRGKQLPMVKILL